MKCVECSHPMLPDLTYRRSLPEDRAGFRAHRGRGLCSACQQRAVRSGTLIDHEPVLNKRDVLLDDAIMLVEGRMMLYRDLPAALGTTRHGLTRAVRRAVIAGDERGIRLARHNTYPTKESA